jgi:hypothetical protein
MPTTNFPRPGSANMRTVIMWRNGYKDACKELSERVMKRRELRDRPRSASFNEFCIGQELRHCKFNLAKLRAEMAKGMI